MRFGKTILITTGALVCGSVSQPGLAQGRADSPAHTAARSLAFSSLPGTSPSPHMVHKSAGRSSRAGQRPVLHRNLANTYPRSHYEKGLYFKQKGELDTALVEFLKATQQNPQLVRALYEQALIFRQRGYLKLAESSLDQALAINQEFKEARVLRATIRLEQGDLGSAVQELSRSLGLGMPNGAASTRPDRSEKGSGKEKTPPPTLSSLSKAVGDAFVQAPAVLQSLHGIIASTPVHVYDQPKPPQGPLKASRPGINFNLRRYPEIMEPIPGRGKKPPPLVQEATPPTVAKTDLADKLDGKKESSPEPEERTFAHRLRFFWSHNHSEKVSSTSQTSEKAKVPRLEASERSAHNTLERQEKSGSQSTEELTSESNSIKAATKSEHKPRRWLLKLLNRGEDEQSIASSEKPLSSKAGGAEIARTLQSAYLSAKRSKACAAEHLDTDQANETNVASNPLCENHTPATQTSLPERQIASTDAGANAFHLPHLPSNDQQLLTTAAASGNAPEKQSPPPPSLPEDEWTAKLRYLVEHGTASLKEGEAFMFSEDSGEASLFLADGTTVRRQISPARDAQEVVRQRRPDILVPQDLLYNLSLLGKLMPRQPEQLPETTAMSTDNSEATPSNFNVNDLMGRSESFWGWLKHLFKL